MRGGDLAAFTFGAASAPSVLAIHGLTSNSHIWMPLGRALVGTAIPVAPDLRGRGRSRGLPGPYGIDEHARDMVAVLDHLGIDRTAVLGHSLGAWIAAALATARPDRVGSVVLIDGGLLPPILVPEEQFLPTALARQKKRFPTAHACYDWWRRLPAFEGGDVCDADLFAYANHDLAGEEPGLHSGVVEQAVREDAADLRPGIRKTQELQLPAGLLYPQLGQLCEPAVRWAQERPALRRAVGVPDVNHYTIVLGSKGARAVARIVNWAIEAAR